MRRALACAALCLFSCAHLGKGEPCPPPIIRYMSLTAVYDVALNRSRDALNVKKALDAKNARARELEKALEDSTRDEAALREEYRLLKKEIEDLNEKSRAHKHRILSRIDRAVKNVAAKTNADFIFNIGDQLLHARREYDVTEDVIKEWMRIEERSAPEAR